MRQLYFLGIEVSKTFKVQQIVAWMEASYLKKNLSWFWVGVTLECDVCVQFLVLRKSSGGYFCILTHTMDFLLSYFPGSPQIFVISFIKAFLTLILFSWKKESGAHMPLVPHLCADSSPDFWQL